jgi:hypothetical protein
MIAPRSNRKRFRMPRWPSPANPTADPRFHRWPSVRPTSNGFKMKFRVLSPARAEFWAPMIFGPLRLISNLLILAVALHFGLRLLGENGFAYFTYYDTQWCLVGAAAIRLLIIIEKYRRLTTLRLLFGRTCRFVFSEDQIRINRKRYSRSHDFTFGISQIPNSDACEYYRNALAVDLIPKGSNGTPLMEVQDPRLAAQICSNANTANQLSIQRDDLDVDPNFHLNPRNRAYPERN